MSDYWTHMDEMRYQNEMRMRVNSPTNPAYYRHGIECWDYINSNNLDYMQGNIVKYVTRFRKKNGVEDLKKAKAYLEKLIQLEESK